MSQFAPAFRKSRVRESHLLNPPPGSTDPERFATVSIGIGDRVLFHPAPREPRHELCEVSLRTEAGRSQATCLSGSRPRGESHRLVLYALAIGRGERLYSTTVLLGSRAARARPPSPPRRLLSFPLPLLRRATLHEARLLARLCRRLHLRCGHEPRGVFVRLLVVRLQI